MLSICSCYIFEGTNQIDWKKWGKRAAIGAGVLGGISLAHKAFNQQPGGNGNNATSSIGAAVLPSAGIGSKNEGGGSTSPSFQSSTQPQTRPISTPQQPKLHTYSEPPGKYSNEAYIPQSPLHRLGGSLPVRPYASVHPQSYSQQGNIVGGGFVGPTNAQSRIVPMGAKPFAYDHSKTPFDNIHTREMSLPVSADQWSYSATTY